MSMANIHWLPPEIRCKIYDLLPFESKKILRTVDRTIRNEIDECRELVFNVKLRDETIDLVQNVTFPRIDKLHVENFTTAINSTNIPTIHTVIFEDEISFAGLGNLLTLCNENTVEKLKFGHSFIPAAAANMDGLEFGHDGQYVLPHVTTMEILVGDNEDLANDSNPESRSKKLFDFLKNHLTLPSLEKIDILVDLDLTSSGHLLRLFAQHIFSPIYNYVNGLTGLKSLGLTIATTRVRSHSQGQGNFVYRRDQEVKIDGISLDCPQLEELALKLDLFYYSIGSPNKIGCKMLKKLRIDHGLLQSSSSRSESAIIRDLISNNSNTLESVSFKSYVLALSWLNLQSCSKLKELSLCSTDLETTEFNNIPFSPEFNLERNGALRRLNLEIGLGKDVETEFQILQRILERIPNGMEEFEFKPQKYLGMAKLKWILDIPNLRKLILAEIEPGDAEFMARRCKKQVPDITCSVTVVPKKWRNVRNLCIQK